MYFRDWLIKWNKINWDLNIRLKHFFLYSNPNIYIYIYQLARMIPTRFSSPKPKRPKNKAGNYIKDRKGVYIKLDHMQKSAI